MNPEDAATGSGESSGRVLPLQYARSGIAEHGRFWAWAFLISGGYGLACIPAVFVVERLKWDEGPVHDSGIAAWAICFAGALTYLGRNPGGGGEGATWVAKRRRMLAYAAIALTCGAMLLLIGEMMFWRPYGFHR